MDDATEAGRRNVDREPHRLPAVALLEEMGEGEESLCCAYCKRVVDDHEDVVEIAPEIWHCEGCAAGEVERITREAAAYALAKVTLTGPILPYDPILGRSVTPKEYADGGTPEEHAGSVFVTYTEHEYKCRCRHKFSNYEKLIQGLSRDDWRHQIRYDAIRERIDELVDNAMVCVNLDPDERE